MSIQFMSMHSINIELAKQSNNNKIVWLWGILFIMLRKNFHCLIKYTDEKKNSSSKHTLKWNWQEKQSIKISKLCLALSYPIVNKGLKALSKINILPSHTKILCTQHPKLLDIMYVPEFISSHLFGKTSKYFVYI